MITENGQDRCVGTQAADELEKFFEIVLNKFRNGGIWIPSISVGQTIAAQNQHVRRLLGYHSEYALIMAHGAVQVGCI